MLQALKTYWHGFGEQFSHRYLMLVSLLGLLMVSTTMIVSASMPYAESIKVSPLHFVYLEFAYLLLGLVGCFIASKIPLRLMFDLSFFYLIITLLLLCMVFLFDDTNGAKRWIRFAGFTFQPSELAKFVMVLFTADYVVRRQSEVRFSFFGFIRLGIPLGFVLLLLLLEPDLGASFVVAVSMMTVFFLAGAPAKQFFSMMAVGVVALFVAIFSSDYRRARLLSFTNPWDNRLGDDFQLFQSLQAFGHGQFSGVGLGQSIQKLLYLPEAHTDFMLAIIGEELGFIGVVVVFALLALLIVSCMRIGHRALVNKHDRAGYLAYGIASIFLVQTFVNGGMNMGLLPTKGLTLPFISYGGSALLVYLGMIGVMLRIEKETRQPVPRTARAAMRL